MDGLKAALIDCLKALRMSVLEEGATIFDLSRDALHWVKMQQEGRNKQHLQQFDFAESSTPAVPTEMPLVLLNGFIATCSQIDFWGTNIMGYFAVMPHPRDKPTVVLQRGEPHFGASVHDCPWICGRGSISYATQ